MMVPMEGIGIKLKNNRKKNPIYKLVAPITCEIVGNFKTCNLINAVPLQL